MICLLVEMSNKFATYIRVSTRKQGSSGLGLAAQQSMCDEYVSRHGGIILERFQDVESGTHRDRPGLWAAIDYCKAHSTLYDQCTLVIAKLDRLARDVEFTFRIVNTGIQIVFVDMPQMNTLLLGVFASVAQYERELCSNRTKSALKEIKEDIAKQGGHMTPEGRWVKALGAPKGHDWGAIAGEAAGLSHHKKAQDWRASSALYIMVENRIRKGIPRKDILAEAQDLYKKNPALYGTRNGKPLCEGTLSRWIKEIRL